MAVHSSIRDQQPPWRARSELLNRFENCRQRTPAGLALVDRGRDVCYEELNESADSIAYELFRIGVGPGSVVAVHMERSALTVATLIAVWKVGAAYLPIDPTLPADRIRFMLEDSGAAVVVVVSTCASQLEPHPLPVVFADCVEKNRPTSALSSGDDDAYVMYTSGSTGRPKGVIGQHSGLLNRLSWMWEAYPFAEGEFGCHKTSLGFGDSIWEIFGPLLQGVPAVIVGVDEAKDPRQLAATIARFAVTRLVVVPAQLRMLLDHVESGSTELTSVTTWSVSGDALTPELVARFRQLCSKAMLLNLYGTTEVSADVTVHDVTADRIQRERIPLGRPIANTTILLLDEALNPVGEEEIGEICVAGMGLARGYCGDAAITRECFTYLPDDLGKRIYRTGDLGRWTPDGLLEFCGRRDRQIKVRGFRVDPAEVEAALRMQPEVADVVVSAVHDEFSSQLVAHVVRREGATVSPTTLRDAARAKLASYMVPSRYVFIDALPRTAGGKVDYRSLPTFDALPDLTTSENDVSGDTEQKLVALWTEVLAVARVAADDDFFLTGGDSIRAVVLVARIRAAFAVDLPLATFMAAPTLGEVSKAIRDARATN